MYTCIRYNYIFFLKVRNRVTLMVNVKIAKMNLQITITKKLKCTTHNLFKIISSSWGKDGRCSQLMINLKISGLNFTIIYKFRRTAAYF